MLYLILLLYGFHEARGSQFNVPITLSSTPPPLYATLVRAKLQVPASAVVEPSGPAVISKIHNKLAPSPKPYLGRDNCLVSPEGLRLHQGPYCMAYVPLRRI
jgi:hypothetical protein